VGAAEMGFKMAAGLGFHSSDLHWHFRTALYMGWLAAIKRASSFECKT
jgi:hypothetical protein